MTQNKFLGTLTGLSFVLVLVLLGIHSFLQLASAQYFTWGVLLFFISLTLAVYYLGKQLAHSKDKNAFTRLILWVMMVKMIICVLCIVAYLKLMEPTNRLFLIPFFLIYLVYTIFEVYLMTILGKTNLSSNEKTQ